jgi:hypothetical protein
MDNYEAMSTISTIYGKIMQSDNDELKMIKTLELILLNTRIQESHIKETTGIKPIIDELERVIHKMKLNNETLIKENREPLENAIDYMNKYIKDGDSSGSN